MDISTYLEHTILKQGMADSTIKDNYETCSFYKIPVFVIPPSFLKFAAGFKQYYKDISLCTVIGFPLGYSTFETKLFEIKNALENGADEIDLVIDNSLVKNNKFNEIDMRLASYRKTCEGKILKIIVETSLLTRNELEKTAKLLIENSIDYIKTSTGFVGDGAKIDDIRFLKDNFGSQIKIKASGGIKTISQVIQFIKAGADRIGTSSAKQILEK